MYAFYSFHLVFFIYTNSTTHYIEYWHVLRGIWVMTEINIFHVIILILKYNLMCAPLLECVSNQEKTWECHLFELCFQDLCPCLENDST